jgi:hypothetical protein
MEDENDALRVTIVTGVSTKNPSHYVVAIGPSLNELKDSDSKLFLTVSRLNRMESASTANLDRFLAAYRGVGGYFLVPAQFGSPPTFMHQLFLVKRHLHIREAWEIAENDPDMMVLQDDDDPIIPPTVLNPPVNKALERIRRLRKRLHSRV